MPRAESWEISRWRGMDAASVLTALSDYAKRDPTFAPIKSATTTRWHATVKGREFELLLTGCKFFDTRAQTGGGGAIDLAMHVLSADFKAATDALRRLGL